MDRFVCHFWVINQYMWVLLSALDQQKTNNPPPEVFFMFLLKFISYSGGEKKLKQGGLQQCYDDLLWLSGMCILFNNSSTAFCIKG